MDINFSHRKIIQRKMMQNSCSALATAFTFQTQERGRADELKGTAPSFCGAFFEASECTYILSHRPHLIAKGSKKYHLTAKHTSQGSVIKEEGRRVIVRQSAFFAPALLQNNSYVLSIFNMPDTVSLDFYH